MNRAYCMVRDQPQYRRHAFLSGLREAGLNVVSILTDPRPGDVVVTWNRYAHYETEAKRFERGGAAVVVAENGFVGHHECEFRKPYHRNGEQLYALALWHHNGAGRWWEGEPGRWRDQGIEIKPWRESGEHVLVLPQRNIGPPGVAMPHGWAERAVQQLSKLTDRPIRVRPHPGNVPTPRPLEKDLAGAWCVATWGSGAALKAVCGGVPAFSEPASPWIGRACSFDLGADVEQPLMRDDMRERMLDRVAWAQHTVSELASGEPFRQLMELYNEGRQAHNHAA